MHRPALLGILLLLEALSGSARAAAAGPETMLDAGDDAPLAEVLAYREIDAGLSTAGQITAAQIPLLRDAGFGLVINLAVADEARNGEEGFLVSREGLAYAQIPVLWASPTLADLDLFFAVMDARAGRRTLVHCFANFRASAFTYLYRTLRLGVPEPEARADLEAIWTDEAFAEYPQWAAFIEQARAHYGEGDSAGDAEP
ncbi:MAG: protein tyrosine phosphatase family protein [Pseudomonadales bacterium]|jgi:protein tyrosine phosphatase (PTP) superfamily phosphohydrolase (DUF442 family)|nr:protein tyrosine phosphatase family protein [Pseudomonadales bacterium]